MDCRDEERGREKKREKYSSFQCLSPRWLLCRWLSKGKRGISETWSEKEERENIRLRSLSLDCGNQLQPSSAGVELIGVPHLADVSGRHTKEDSINLGVGVVLFYLIAESKKELSKMIDLRREMEAFVHSTRNEFDTNKMETLYEPSEYNNYACSTIDAYGSLCSDSLHNLSLENQTEPLISSSCEQSLMINSTSHEKCAEGIDQLEAELESELELLQVPTDNRSSEGRSSPSFTEAVDVLEVDSSEQYGVCPQELERRLHELIQSMQQKKIEELEAVLQRANQKLLEREREVSWLRETARIFSRHVPEASRLSRLGKASYRVD